MTLTRYIAACNPNHLLMPIGTWERESRQGEALRPWLFERPEDAQAAGGGKEPIKITITLEPPSLNKFSPQKAWGGGAAG